MALNAAGIFRLRVGGNVANGAGFDSTVSGAGTDYSQQDAAQASASLGTSTNSTTFTDVSALFTSAMVGNYLKISSGAGATVKIYRIDAFTNSSTITLDQVSGTYTAAVWKIGGAARLPENIGTYVVAGNIVYILGSAGNASSYPTSSLDYSTTGYFTPTAGTVAAGRVRWLKDPAGPIPTIGSNGLMIYNFVGQEFSGLYFTASSNASNASGILFCASSAAMTSILTDSIVNTNNQALLVGITWGGGCVKNNEIYGGTTTPTASSGADLVVLSSYSCEVVGNTIRYGRGIGIKQGNNQFGSIHDNQIYGCVGNGIEIGEATSAYIVTVAGNVIDANGGHGISITGTGGVSNVSIRNNNITNHTGSGKSGISVTNGTTALNDIRKGFIDYNNVYGNTTNYANISAGAHDISVDPGYTGSGNYAAGTAIKAKGFPALMPLSVTTNYKDIGMERQEAGGTSRPSHAINPPPVIG